MAVNLMKTAKFNPAKLKPMSVVSWGAPLTSMYRYCRTPSDKQLMPQLKQNLVHGRMVLESPKVVFTLQLYLQQHLQGWVILLMLLQL